MKTSRIYLSAMLLAILASCAQKEDSPVEDQNISEISGLTEDVYFEQTGDVNSIGLVEHYQLMLQEATENNADDSDLLEYIQDQLDAAEEYTQECVTQSGANWDEGADGQAGVNRQLGYEYTTIRYKSIGYDGGEAILSALVVWPFNNLIADPDANNVVIGCHVTIGSNAERPSNYGKGSIMTDVGMIACCAKTYGIGSEHENLVIIPDYQGYGATHGDVHPYLYQNLTARQVLDGVRAGIAYYKQSHKLEKDWKSLSLGYSQGGSVAMAVHRYIEKNNLVDEFNFAGSVCGNGPYDPLTTLKKYIDTQKSYMPVSAAMMMHSMCNTSPRLRGYYTADIFLTKEFIESGIIELIKGKQLDTDQMQQKLLDYSFQFTQDNKNAFCMYRSDTDGNFWPYRSDTKNHEGKDISWESGYIKTAYANFYDMMNKDCWMYFLHGRHFSPDTNVRKALYALEKALNDNVLHSNWTPEHPIFLYHTNEDEVVVVENFNNCLSAWEGSSMVKGAIYKGRTHTHVNYGKVFLMKHCTEGINAIFDGKADKYPFRREITGIW